MAETTTLRVCDVPIVGRSVAGQESFYRLPTLRSALEIGRCPNALVAVPNVFVTHAHLDHAAGVASYASQRTLQGLEAGRVFLPAEAMEGFEKILALHVELEGFHRYAAHLKGVRPGDRIPLRHDLEVDVTAGSHRVPCAGYVFCETRRKLRRDLAGTSGEEIARLRERGIGVTEEIRTPLLAYPGDCDAGIFDVAPEIFRARILLLECTFIRPGEEERAARYRHLHLSQIAARASDFANEAIVLTHFSAKYSREEIEERVKAGLPDSLRDRVVAFV
ncbi:MAG TPA: MBL fold metallo-hydrolase [Thermoanaerobaculia bacterium]|nr:MBL fold metallo-hydrolase [Thermoanaerobaculia bacterium]